MKPTLSILLLLVLCLNDAESLSFSSFHGHNLAPVATYSGDSKWFMRKQKASHKTRRMQRGEDDEVQTITRSPMQDARWSQKTLMETKSLPAKTGGRNRSRKRSMLYNSLSSYHSHFLQLLTAEYKTEEDEVTERLKASLDDPLALEAAGFALFDLYAERRGNLFSDEVYRLVKAHDASTLANSTNLEHKLSQNDVVMLTYQPNGSGDFFGSNSLPISDSAVSAEARVLNTGPTYIDIVMPGGAFEAAFGPAPNDLSGKGNRQMRLRLDRFFSDVPYQRMVAALSQLTNIQDKRPKSDDDSSDQQAFSNICMDELLRETVLSTFSFNDASSILFHDTDACDFRELARRIAKPPLPNSVALSNQVLEYIQTNPHGIFNPFNGPQLTAIGAALTRRLTLIQGPPGTGKTTVGSAIAFGFVHQCRSISPSTKVLACAFSNVGADNLAESLLKLGLKVVRVGKASAVSPSLWNHTLDAAINADPTAQRALEQAAAATAQLNKVRQRNFSAGQKKNDSILSEQSKRDAATAAVKASIKACNVAATKALRGADVIVSTSTGASDPRLLAACGVIVKDEDDPLQTEGRLVNKKPKLDTIRARVGGNNLQGDRSVAPDGMTPLTLPFVLIDEACQSVEPATLVPLVSSNSCRSLVCLGDPCQLPPTVRSSPTSPLSVSLMERLAASLPQPVIVTAQNDSTEKDTTYLDAKPVKQAQSLIRMLDSCEQSKTPYRKRFAGSLLLSVQYRMHPSISAFSSAIFYDSLLSTPAYLAGFRQFPEKLTSSLPVDATSHNVRFVNVGGRSNELRGSSNLKFSREGALAEGGTSYSNQLEAARVVELLKELIASEEHGAQSIGVVTPYSGQVQLIMELMKKDEDYIRLASELGEAIEVKSVDGYQGRERDVIIFSAVRSNRSGSLGFLTDWRRMNVALTRSKIALIVVGDLETLEAGDKHWAAFAKWCHASKCIVSS